MLFGSFEFLLGFLPVCLAVYHACRVNGRHGAAKLFLIVASLVFYGWWDARYVLLILASIGANYGFGLLLRRRPGFRRPEFWAAIAFNLGLLGYYKYAGFFAANLEALTGWELGLRGVVLPLAISFFTFQQVAYVTEVARGDPPARSLADYMLFILFFPHLIAGPITHHREMLPQFAAAGRGPLSSRWVLAGAGILVLGLAKKVLLADTLAAYADPVFNAARTGAAPAAADAWLGALAYTLQLYFDFSGYSDMAIGLGLLFGIRFPVNFASPYKATSIVEFWRRWHVTLSNFLRVYVYVPLGGNRRGPARRHLNLLATMALGGLWHGAAWTFVIWGLLHGVLLIANHAWRAAFGEIVHPAFRALAWAATFGAVVVGWVFFRAPSVPAALAMLGAMAGLGAADPVPGIPGPVFGWLAVAGAGLLAVASPSVLQLFRYPHAFEHGASPKPGEPQEPLPAARPAAPPGFAPVRTSLARPALLRPALLRPALIRPALIRPALAAVALGLVAGACIARLPDPGVFLYFNF